MLSYKETIESEKCISPYKILLGAIFRRLIDDALMYKGYKGLRQEIKDDPKKYGYQRQHKINTMFHVASKARYFIFSKLLVEMIDGARAMDPSFELDADYFRKKFSEEESKLDGSYEKEYSKIQLI